MTTQTVDSMESSFLRDSYQSLPKECAVVTPPGRMGRGRIESAFPFYEYRSYLPGNDNFNWGLSRVDQPMLDGLHANNPCVLYYRGLACTTFIPEEAMEGSLRPECKAFESTHKMHKLTSVSIDGSALPTHLHQHPKGTFELAFFRLEPPNQPQMSPGVQ